VVAAREVGREIARPGRVLSVDVLRGLTIALMILVNDPGDWSHVFAPLDHAEWNGWTLTDLVFPTFLFLMGASMVFSNEARRAKGDCTGTLAGHVFARAGKLFALAMLLNLYPRFHWTNMRFYGVLPRIAVCYLLAGLVLLGARRMVPVAAIVAVMLVGYWVLLRWVPVPGAGMPVRDVPLMDKTMNIVAWVDRGVVAWTQRWLHVGRLFQRTRDPEGLLSTLPAVASVLVGAAAGMWMRTERGRRRWLWLMVAGVAGVAAGEIWGHWFPINKNLWTSSYVLLAGGWSAIALGLLSWVVDGREQPWPRWLRVLTWPWLVFGSNAIAAFTVSVLIVETMIRIKLTDPDGDKNSLWAATYENVFSRNGSTEWTSLAFAATFVVICFLPNWWLWRKRVFLKV